MFPDTMASCAPDWEDLYDEKITPNRCQLVKYIETSDILDQLRANRTISPDDAEEIDACSTRRRRAAKFLDILQTKGDNGVTNFFQAIELVYPDLYQAVTGQLPRTPPPNFKRHSRMPSLRIINHLPEIAKDLKIQYQSNRELVSQLQELETAMLFEQTDNKELEKENFELRKKIESLRKDRDKLESQVATFLKDNHRLKDESMNYMNARFEYQQQSELYKLRAMEIQAEKDELERTFHRIRNEHQEGLRKSRLSLGVSFKAASSNETPQTLSPRSSDPSALDTAQIIRQQMEQEKLDELQMELTQTSEDLLEVRSQFDDIQNLYNKAKNTTKNLRKERAKLDKMLERQRSLTNHYFEIIQQLEGDKKQLEEERIKEQKNVSEESEKRNKLFMANHRLEQAYTALMAEVKRSSQESADDDNEDFPRPTENRQGIYEPGLLSGRSDSVVAQPGNSFLRRDDLDYQTRPRLDTDVAKLVAKIGLEDSDTVPRRRYYNRGRLNVGQYVTMEVPEEISNQGDYKSDESISNSEDRGGPYTVLDDMVAPYIQSLTQNRQTFTVKVPTPVLNDKFEITGGNITGIYVKWVKKKLGIPISVGDKVLSVGIFITDIQALHTDMVYRTLEEATQILEAQADPSHANVVEIKFERDPEAYEKAQKWITNHDGSGDLFFVQNNYSPGECPSTQNRDILCVTSTVTSCAKYWTAYKFDKGSNSWSTEQVSLPNVTEVLRIRRGGTLAPGTMQRGRQQAFKHRPYSRVLPAMVSAVSGMTDYSAETEGDPLATQYPQRSKFSGQIHWLKEIKLDMSDVEKYRHLVGYSTDMSFGTNSLEIDDKVCRSISMPDPEHSSL